jgi:hypothetical protein
MKDKKAPEYSGAFLFPNFNFTALLFYRYKYKFVYKSNFMKNVLFIILLIFFSQSQAQINGLVAYYPFNGNAGDSSGLNNHGVVSGAALTTGRYGQSNTAYYFDGVSNKITVSASASIQPQYKLTLTAWVQPDSKPSAGWATILTKRYAPATDPYNSYSLSNYNNGKWGFDISNGTTGSQKTATAKTATPYGGGWVFLSATYDSTQAKLYINGVLDTVISFTGSIGYTTNDLVIGYTTSGPNDFYKGKIDEIRIYNRALSQAEISQLYSPDGLVAYYPFNGNAGDSSGLGNHGSVIGATPTIGKKGIANTAYYFDGVSNKITVSASPSLHPKNTLTITAWVQPESKPSAGWATILTKRYSPGADPYNSYSLSTYNNGKWGFDISNGTTGSQKTAKAKTTTPFDGGWIFLCASYDSTQAKLYVNGTLDTAISFTGNIGYSNNDLVIGYTTSGPNDYYKGKIDEIKIYNRALSSTEIASMYALNSGINDVHSQSENTLSVYPNPNTGNFTIESILQRNAICTVMLSNMIGEKVWSNSYQMQAGKNTTSININTLLPGVYFLQIEDESKQFTEVQKIIVR